jgi:hypothetical protein
MQPSEFVALLRSQYVDGIQRVYGEMFAQPLERFSDDDMLEMARFWQGANPEVQSMLAKFMRLGSQASVASILAVLDNTASDFNAEFSLTAQSPDGTRTELSQDLLDTFWEQEQGAGRVGHKAT